MRASSARPQLSERRTIVYVVGLGFFFLLLILAAFLGRAYLSGAVNKESWTKQNELVLSTLPLYPGATEARAPYSTGEPDPMAKTQNANGGPFRGYWTAHTYTLPLGARPDLVLAFYAQRLGGWSFTPVPGSICDVSYRRDRALLNLKACDGSLELRVNYREFE
ncbi:MAG: hypothetical protein WBQ14_06690 [Gaiellaceae bacterium]